MRTPNKALDVLLNIDLEHLEQVCLGLDLAQRSPTMMQGPGNRLLRQQLSECGIDFTDWMATIYPKHYAKPGVDSIPDSNVSSTVSELKSNMEKEAPQEPDNNLDIGGFHI